MVTGLVVEQRTDMRELHKVTGRIEGGLVKVMVKTVEGNAHVDGQLKMMMNMIQQLLPSTVVGVSPTTPVAKTTTPAGSAVPEEVPETSDEDSGGQGRFDRIAGTLEKQADETLSAAGLLTPTCASSTRQYHSTVIPGAHPPAPFSHVQSSMVASTVLATHLPLYLATCRSMHGCRTVAIIWSDRPRASW